MLSEQASRRILIIDDNLDIHADFRAILAGSESDASALDDLETDLFGDRCENDATAPTGFAPYELSFAAQGAEGLELHRRALAADRPFALAFVDMRMPPGWDGMQTIEALWAEDPRLQVVICTAYSDHPHAEIVGRLGTGDNLLILKKPFDTEEVAQLASALVAKKEIERRNRLYEQQMEQTILERTEAMARAEYDEELARAKVEQLEERIRNEHEQLIHSEKLACIGQLAAGVAHEINNPVGFLTSNLTTLSDYFRIVRRLIGHHHAVLQALSDDACRCAAADTAVRYAEEEDIDFILGDVDQLIAESLEGAGRVKEIVDSLRTYARADLQEPAPTNLNQGLAATIRMLNNELKYKCDLEVDLKDLPVYIGFSGQLNQVFTNLLVNACHAIKERGHITVRSRCIDETIIVSVQDDGCGIPQDIRLRIFDPFFTTKPIGQGTGLGLSVSQSIVSKHGGRIAIDSQPDKGTTVSVILPLPGAIQTEDDEAPENVPRSCFEKIR